MAVRASTVEVLDRLQRLRLRWVAARDMAGVANPWHSHLQQLWVTAAVGIVAVRAIFHDRRVLPKERAPPLSVATETVLVQSRLDQLGLVGASVRVMTACARDFAFAIRHMGRALQLRPPHLVTLQA